MCLSPPQWTLTNSNDTLHSPNKLQWHSNEIPLIDDIIWSSVTPEHSIYSPKNPTENYCVPNVTVITYWSPVNSLTVTFFIICLILFKKKTFRLQNLKIIVFKVSWDLKKNLIIFVTKGLVLINRRDLLLEKLLT